MCLPRIQERHEGGAVNDVDNATEQFRLALGRAIDAAIQVIEEGARILGNAAPPAPADDSEDTDGS